MGQEREEEPMSGTKNLITKKINWKRKERLAQHPRDTIKKQIMAVLVLNDS